MSDGGGPWQYFFPRDPLVFAGPPLVVVSRWYVHATVLRSLNCERVLAPHTVSIALGGKGFDNPPHPPVNLRRLSSPPDPRRSTFCSYAQSVYEVETRLTAVPPSVSPEALFLCACRALAYSVSSAAAATSPLDSLRGHAAAAAAALGSGAGAAAGGAIDHGDANRLRCLRLVAEALRRAAGQAGLEDTVGNCRLF